MLFDEKNPLDIQKLDEAQWQRLSRSIYPNKPLKKCFELARVIQDINADIVMLAEVGGLESLVHFNELFLQQAYSVALIEGNSDRNIDVGFLIRKNSSFYFDLQTNKNRPIQFLYPHEKGPDSQLPSHKFSRDAVELKLFSKDANHPFLTVILTHLKSRLDPEGIDPQGYQRRKAELNTLLEIYKELSVKYPESGFVVAGDFNGNASRNQTDEEFQPIYTTTDLEDVLELAGQPQPQRATYYQVRNAGRTEGRQIDYCFISENIKKALKADSAYIYRYKDKSGLEIDIPQSLDAKMSLPSDHYPIVFSLENLKVR